MSKRQITPRMNSTILSLMVGMGQWSGAYWDDHKELEGSPIYIPKRHKFKRRNKK